MQYITGGCSEFILQQLEAQGEVWPVCIEQSTQRCGRACSSSGALKMLLCHEGKAGAPGEGVFSVTKELWQESVELQW